MLCTLTARRLRADTTYDAFREAWDPGTIARATELGWTRIYHVRDIEDPRVVISFGLFDGTVEELRVAQESLRRATQLDRVGPHVEEVLLDGSYEVVEELES